MHTGDSESNNINSEKSLPLVVEEDVPSGKALQFQPDGFNQSSIMQVRQDYRATVNNQAQPP